MRRLALLAVVSALLAACSPQHEPAPTGKPHAHHVHTAPHGGTLVELGEHQFNLEFVRDAAAGTLTAYVLDAHAENFVRVPLRSFELIAIVGRERWPLALTAVGNPATGETAGDTAEFTAQADWLKITATFDAVLPALEIRGAKFADVKFGFPQGLQD